MLMYVPFPTIIDYIMSCIHVQIQIITSRQMHIGPHVKLLQLSHVNEN